MHCVTSPYQMHFLAPLFYRKDVQYVFHYSSMIDYDSSKVFHRLVTIVCHNIYDPF